MGEETGRMGQASSAAACAHGVDHEEEEVEEEAEDKGEGEGGRSLLFSGMDLTVFAPDECLAAVFQKLELSDRRQCSLVCKRWYSVEGQARQRLSLQACVEIGSALPALLERFQHITKLTLKCDRKRCSIDDDALCVVGRGCQQLRKLKLKACKGLTDQGIDRFAKLCGSSLRKFSCGSCQFGPQGLNSILQHCANLEDLTVKRLKGFKDSSEFILPNTSCSIRRLCLKDFPNGQLLVYPLIAQSKNLHTLMLSRISGNWDLLFESITVHMASLVELHIEKVMLTDRGLQAVACCTNLQVLYVVKPSECTNKGLSAIANGCPKLCKLHIDSWKNNQLGDEGLATVARNCKDLQELVIIGLNATMSSLSLLASNCSSLERLAICTSDTFGDLELSCIADKCLALKRLCIKGCPISDRGMEALVGGCPSLVKIKVKKCRAVTPASVEWLLTNRVSLVVALDTSPTPVAPEAQVKYLIQLPQNLVTECACIVCACSCNYTPVMVLMVFNIICRRS